MLEGQLAQLKQEQASAPSQCGPRLIEAITVKFCNVSALLYLLYLLFLLYLLYLLYLRQATIEKCC
jgi:hypothetical protein